MIGMKSWVTQEELKYKNTHIDTRGTAKALVLEGGTKLTNLIETILYGTKPVQCIIMVSEELKWVIKENECLNVETSKVKLLRFLHMNYINKNCNKMGGVDIS